MASPSPSPSLSPFWKLASARRAPARWIRRGGSALVVSVVAHAALAVTAGTLLKLTATPPVSAQEPMLVDVVQAPPVPAETTAAGPVAPQLPAPRGTRPPAHHRPDRGVTPASAPARAAGPASVGIADVPAAPARFALAVGTIGTIGTQVRPAPLAAAAHVDDDGGDGNVVGEGDVTVPARLVWASPLVYPAAARQAEVEVDLPLEIVVAPDGRVAAARAVSRVGYGLEEAALQALRAYRFSPALRAGRPVRVRMRWTVQFRLR